MTETIAGVETTAAPIGGRQEHARVPTTVAAVGRRAAIVVARRIVIETVSGVRAPVGAASRIVTGDEVTIETVDRAAPVVDPMTVTGVVTATGIDALVALAAEAAVAEDGSRTVIVGRPVPVVAVVVDGKTGASVGAVRLDPMIGRHVMSVEPGAAVGRKKSVSVT